MRYAEAYKAPKHALAFLHTLPKRFHTLATFNMVLQVCAAANDLETATAAIELVKKLRLRMDTKLLTSYINGGGLPWAS